MYYITVWIILFIFHLFYFWTKKNLSNQAQQNLNPLGPNGKRELHNKSLRWIRCVNQTSNQQLLQGKYSLKAMKWIQFKESCLLFLFWVWNIFEWCSSCKNKRIIDREAATDALQRNVINNTLAAESRRQDPRVQLIECSKGAAVCSGFYP